MKKLIDILVEDFPKGKYVEPTSTEKNQEKEVLFDLIHLMI